jgi:predicted DNA-binding transcriptional regulator AlpA
MDDALVGPKEVARLLGVSRQRVDKITQTHREFPPPVGRLAAGRIWKREEIIDWATKTGRKLYLHGQRRRQ